MWLLQGPLPSLPSGALQLRHLAEAIELQGSPHPFEQLSPADLALYVPHVFAHIVGKKKPKYFRSTSLMFVTSFAQPFRSAPGILYLFIPIRSALFAMHTPPYGKLGLRLFKSSIKKDGYMKATIIDKVTAANGLH